MAWTLVLWLANTFLRNHHRHRAVGHRIYNLHSVIYVYIHMCIYQSSLCAELLRDKIIIIVVVVAVFDVRGVVDHIIV